MGTDTVEALGLFREALAVLPVTSARLRADRDTIAKCTETALRRHLRVYTELSYGSDALRQAGIEPETATVTDLPRLAPLTKMLKHAHFARLNRLGLTLAEAETLLATSASARPRALRNVRVLVTSGTQQRSVALTTVGGLLRDHSHALAMTLDAVRGTGLLHRPKVSVVAVVGTGTAHVSNVSARMLSRLPFAEVTIISATEPADRLLDRARQLRPDVVLAYARKLRVLVEAQTRGDLDWHRPLLFSGAEKLDPWTIRAAARLGWPCWDSYGSTETGTIAAGVAGDMRVLRCDVIVEPVSRYGELVPYGTWSDAVLVTKLTGGIQPMVRFRLDDEVRLIDTGEPLPRLEIRGRSQPAWQWPGGATIEVRALRQILDEAGVAECRAWQTPAGVHADVAPAPGRVLDTYRISAALAGVLRTAGLANPDVQVTAWQTLRSDSGGKASLHWLPLRQDAAA